MALEQIGLLGNSFFTNIILPFVLVFTVIFAVLQKVQTISDKKDINAVVALIFALIVVGVPTAVGVLANIIPVIAVIIVILFTWFLVFGFLNRGGGVKPNWTDPLQKLFAVVIGVILLGVIAWATGLFDYITIDKIIEAQVVQFGLLIGAIIAVISVVVAGTDDSKPAREGDHS